MMDAVRRRGAADDGEQELMRVRSRATAAVTMVALAAVGTGPAYADGSRTVTGPVTGDADIFMTYVGCDSLDGTTSAPGSRLNLGPYSAPLGRRSLGIVPTGTGTACCTVVPWLPSVT